MTQPSTEPATRKYGLTDEQESFLVRPEDPLQVSPLASAVVGVAQALPNVVAAYKSGDGVSFADYGDDMRHGRGGIDRPAFTHHLVDEWIPSVPDVHRRLKEDQPARVADVGCGQGWAAIGVARAYPNAKVIGIDSDRSSIDDARRFAAEEEVDVRFEAADAEQLSELGPFDLVLIP